LLNTILFYFLSAIAVGSAVLMVTRRNAVHAAIFLLTALLATAGIFLQLQAEFLFIIQIFLFAGAIMVLFVLVTMLLNLDVSIRVAQLNPRQKFAAALALVLAAQMLFAISVGRGSLRLAALPGDIAPRNTEAIGDTLLHASVVPFEITSILLLVAMMGAVVMARRKT